MSKTKQRTIVDYINKDKFTKCESFDEKSSSEIKNMISKLSLDCISKSSDQNKKLKEMYSILESKVHGKSIILRKCVLVSLCLVYKDILPTYKIKILTDEQKQQKMKDETIKSYSEEEILLGHYHKYIRVMETVLQKQYNIANLNHIRWTETDELTLLKCASELFINNPEFNYSSSLLKLIVPNLNSTNSKQLKYASKTLESVLKDDMKLEVSFNICEAIKQFSVSNKFNFRSTVLKPFMLMQLEEIKQEERVNHKFQKNKLMSRKEKKDKKKNKEHLEQLEQISAKESMNIKYKKNSQIIRTIFYIYFRVLKRSKVPSKLLETVLEGIKQFGRLVNCDLFPDIFSLMGKIYKNPKVSLENRLRSIFVCLDIVTSGKASDILDVDPGNFCAGLINLINHANLSETSALMIINCSTKLLVKRRNYVSQADAKTLIKSLIKMACVHKDAPHICSTVLVSIVRYLRIYPQFQYIFDDEDEDFTQDSDEVPSKFNNENLNHLQELCKLPTYEIAGIAKSIKKFFIQTDVDNSLYVLKGSLEELTRMKTEDCLQYIKEKTQKPLKRSNDGSDEHIVKKAKCE